ncbi:MAG: 1-phosphofructokinase family hexose kinase [Firmicutes bacterium]|nr:1-phosphofructokinase family hexose kinase [Bacillota bacterium]
MITAVCLKPCIDKTITVDGVKLGQYNKIVDTRSDVSGKGVNVAVVLNRLGVRSRLIGYNFRENGKLLTDMLEKEQVEHSFVYSGGAIRTNIKLIDISDNTMTELNESGGLITDEKKQEFLELFRANSTGNELITLSGSLPVGCEDTFYRDLIASAPCRCVLDCSGESFARGLEAKPYMVKPNKYELELYAGRPLETKEECLRVALDIIDRGVAIVCVSLGGEGALITNGAESYYAPPVKVRVRSTVGAGDSVVAGICKGLCEGKYLRECFAFGVAAGTACVLSEGTSLLSQADYTAMLPRVEIEELRI